MPHETALPPPLPTGQTLPTAQGLPAGHTLAAGQALPVGDPLLAAQPLPARPPLPAGTAPSRPPEIPSAKRSSLAPPVEAPLVAPPVLPSPPARTPFAWWPMARRVSRDLGGLLRNWRYEGRARVAGFSLSVALHTTLFLVLSFIIIPAARHSSPEDEARFQCAIDTIIPAMERGENGAAADVSFTAAAGLPDQAATNVPAGDPLVKPLVIAGADDATPLTTPLMLAPQDEPRIADMSPADEVSRERTVAPSPSAEIAALRDASITAAPKTAVSSAAPDADADAETPSVASAAQGGFEGRDKARRGQMLARYGGTLTSETAVTLGLSWLANHQQADGSWHFNHVGDHCDYYCTNPGSFPSTTAATGLALLPFLGAGHTHIEGDYRETVRRGLFYLGDRMAVTAHGGDLQEGTMYSQGIATIALCEAYGMSHDAELKPYAQSALNFVVYAQDPKGGGWRYAPGQPGDTTITGWQLMALKSGLLAGLEVPQKPFRLASHFLDQVEMDYGAGYGYLKPGKTPTTSAIGVFGRMLTGWRIGRPALTNGVERLAKLGPSQKDMYFNYNATQVMRHFGGETWDKWNKPMREQLIATQSHTGHASGSWYDKDEHGAVGGRLYMTCLACMTLEVYYRHMPLYGDRVTE